MSGLTAYNSLLSNPAYPGNAELQLGTNFRASGFQIPQEAVECGLVGVVLFPLGEVADVALAFDVSGPSGFARHDCFIDSYREESGFFKLSFEVEGVFNVELYQIALYR
jgi:hypothetical protein